MAEYSIPHDSTEAQMNEFTNWFNALLDDSSLSNQEVIDRLHARFSGIRDEEKGRYFDKALELQQKWDYRIDLEGEAVRLAQRAISQVIGGDRSRDQVVEAVHRQIESLGQDADVIARAKQLFHEHYQAIFRK